ncbi:1382_t:CDS:2, partial [Dentiscutata erythropus]
SETGYQVIQGVTYLDGTLLLQVAKWVNESALIIEQGLHLRLIYTNGTVNNIEVNYTFSLFNYEYLNLGIEFYALCQNYFLVIYYNKVNNTSLYQPLGLLITWNGEIKQSFDTLVLTIDPKDCKNKWTIEPFVVKNWLNELGRT